MKKFEFKVESPLLMTHINVPVKIGDLELELVILIHTSDRGQDVDFMDYDNIIFRGCEIENFSKFNKFHIEMGINYRSLIDDEFEQALVTKEFKAIAKDQQNKLKNIK